MYKYMYGKVTDQGCNYIVLEVNNIGYLIYVANPYSYEIGKDYKVYLYNNVKGLGPKLANTFFATGSVSGIVDAINRENILYLTKYPKIGEKLAKQMILDLKGKIDIEVDTEVSDNTDDLVAVLESLGYKTVEIKRILKDIDTSLPVESQVKEA